MYANISSRPASLASLDCEGCGLYKTCYTPWMKGDGDPARPLWIVSAAPGQMEDQDGRPLIGQTGAEVWNAAELAGLARDSFYVDHAVCCRPPKNKLPGKAVTSCRPRVQDLLTQHQPRFVLLFGNEAIRAVMPPAFRTGVLAARGKAYTVDTFPNTTFFVTVHPNYVLRDVGHRGMFQKDIATFAALARGEELEVAPMDIRVITEADAAVAAIEELETHTLVVFDLETTGLDPYGPDQTITAVSFCAVDGVPEDLSQLKQADIQPRTGIALPFNHAENTWTPEEKERVRKAMARLFENPNVRKAGHNLTFDLRWVWQHLNCDVHGDLIDTLMMHYSTNEKPGTHGLKKLAYEFTPWGGYDDELKKALEDAGGFWEKVDLKKLLGYNAKDSFVTGHIFRELTPVVHREQQWTVLTSILFPAVRAVARMINFGCFVDRGLAQEVDFWYQKRAEGLKSRLVDHADIVATETTLIQRRLRQDPALMRHINRQIALNLPPTIENLRKIADKRLQGILDRLEAPGLTEGPTLDALLTVLGKRIGRLQADVDKRLVKREEQLRTTTKFKFKSPAHKRVLLYDVYKLKPTGKTKSGELQTGKAMLKVYGHKFALLGDLDRLATMEKRRATYLRPVLMGAVVKGDGAIHANYMLTGTEGGRMSCGGSMAGKGDTAAIEKYNMQNLPRKPRLEQVVGDERYYWLEALEMSAADARAKVPEYKGDGTAATALLGKAGQAEVHIDSANRLFIRAPSVRPIFTTRYEGGKLIGADYQQLELVVYGVIAQDGALMEAVRKGVDLHKNSACLTFGIPLDQVTPEMRQDIKSAVSFGLAYGRSAEALAEDLKKPLSWAEDVKTRFFKAFKGMANYIRFQPNDCRKNGNMATSMFGRRRRIPELMAFDQKLRSHAERESINMPIQSTASDLCLLSLVMIDRMLEAEKMRTRVVATVHDSIYLDAPRDEAIQAATMLKAVMEGIPQFLPWLTVPLRSDINGWVPPKGDAPGYFSLDAMKDRME